MLTRTCPKCRESKPLTEFELTPKGKPRRRCQNCRNQIRKYSRGWDWAAAVKKSTKMFVHKTQYDMGQYLDSLDVDTIRALLQAQNGVCALSHYTLCIPDDAELIKLCKHRSAMTLSHWATTLPNPRLRDFIPVMVRVNSNENWKPGNVVLIAAMLAPLCRYADDIRGVRTQLLQAFSGPLTIPDQSTLLEIKLQQRTTHGRQPARVSVC